VEARHEPDFDRWVERDLAYIDRWSLLLDLKILLRTVPAVLGRTGK
jgi:lipopolysaccharide/colanic/teichoic acid biosynthesis glycosyltransferase